MLTPQFMLALGAKIVVDIFAGGGGWSTAYEQATGQHVHIAINHNPDALSMHEANHPQTRHYVSDVWEVDPYAVCEGRMVGWLHLSPDCTDHSQAKGGQPRSRTIRALAWVGVRWSGTVCPDVISLENVAQILKWGTLIAKRDPATGRVIKLSGGVAAPGERVPVQDQYLIPNPKTIGRNWRRLVAIWRSQGYTVEWRVLRASDYGAGTTRARLFAIARRDGQPIVWPEATHAAKPTRTQKRQVMAADGIDFSIPGNSIFGRKKPLAEATMRRIALGMRRYVLDCADMFIVPATHQGADRVHSLREPARTITAANRGELMLAAPTLIQAGYGERDGQAPRALDLGQPLGTVTAGGIKHAVATAYMMQANGGFNTTPGHDLRYPASTITNSGSQQQLVAANLVALRRNCVGAHPESPISTITAGAEHHGLVQYQLAPSEEAGALQVAAFLMRYYGSGGQWGDLREPAATLTTRDRLALVTVFVRGTPYVVVDIHLRMLTPRELYRLQGFPDNYIIDRGHDGRIFTKSAQVHMVGNSVSPPPAVALIAANAPRELLLRRAA
jgi:DNA (cytosine-5)-methyltransferase 1